MTNVKGKWCLITGASRGLGRLSALELAERGCNIIVHSRSKEKNEAICAELEAKGVKTANVACEMSDADAVYKMLAEVDALGVEVDFVLSNAAIQTTYRADWLNTPIGDYVENFTVNTVAPAIICYHFLPKMIEKGFGRIVNVTSGIDKEPQQAGYSASKAALDKITKDMATKLQDTDVMLNLADPGWCRTDLGGPMAPNAPESAVTGLILGLFLDDKKSGRIISAQEYAGMTVEESVKTVNNR